jgi:hypothetical protein
MPDRPEMESPVEFFATVVHEALTCDRPQCTPQDHSRFVSENLRIAQNDMTESTR